MASPPASFIPDILEEHVEELAFLWGRRRTALHDSAYTIREFLDLEERITAHRDGVLAVGDHARSLLEHGLTQDDPLAVFAAAFALLHWPSPAGGRVFDAFREADGAARTGLRDALCHGPLDHAAPQLETLYRTAGGPLAVEAGEVLAFHSALRATPEELGQFVQHDDASVRAHGWRLVALLGATVEAKHYAAAMRAGPGPVRTAALAAGAWCRERGMLGVCRKLATDAPAQSLDALELLAILGGPEDLPRFRAAADARDLGPIRFRLLGAFGHPTLMEPVLAGVADADPATAVAAAAAFTKMTGQSVESDRRATLPPAGGGEPDELEAEFQEEVTLPDPTLAHGHWQRVSRELSGAGRLCRGVDAAKPFTPEGFMALDMESRWEVCLRARFEGAWSGSPLRLERFPQGR